jgi:hypothetical protein
LLNYSNEFDKLVSRLRTAEITEDITETVKEIEVYTRRTLNALRPNDLPIPQRATSQDPTSVGQLMSAVEGDLRKLAKVVTEDLLEPGFDAAIATHANDNKSHGFGGVPMNTITQSSNSLTDTVLGASMARLSSALNKLNLPRGVDTLNEDADSCGNLGNSGSEFLKNYKVERERFRPKATVAPSSGVKRVWLSNGERMNTVLPLAGASNAAGDAWVTFSNGEGNQIACGAHTFPGYTATTPGVGHTPMFVIHDSAGNQVTLPNDVSLEMNVVVSTTASCTLIFFACDTNTWAATDHVLYTLTLRITQGSAIHKLRLPEGTLSVFTYISAAGAALTANQIDIVFGAIDSIPNEEIESYKFGDTEFTSSKTPTVAQLFGASHAGGSLPQDAPTNEYHDLWRHLVQRSPHVRKAYQHMVKRIGEGDTSPTSSFGKALAKVLPGGVYDDLKDVWDLVASTKFGGLAESAVGKFVNTIIGWMDHAASLLGTGAEFSAQGPIL